MISRAAIGRTAQRGLRVNCPSQPYTRRGLADVASGSFQYQTGDASGVKYASRDMAGPTTTLAVVVRAGTRHQIAPGFTEGLEKFAFKSTERRSALRITREAELLGGELFAHHTRESLVIGAKFMRDDLPYFTELLGEVVSKTKFTGHEFDEEVVPIIKMAQKRMLGRVSELAINSAHGLAFHRGLGTPLHPSSSEPFTKYLSAPDLYYFSQSAYTKSNLAVVANGTEHQEFQKWVGEFFSDLSDTTPEGADPIQSTQSKYYGGEERIAHASGNAMVLAFPGSSSSTGKFYKPEISVLATLLGGQSNVKWSPGFSLLAKAAENYPGCRVATNNHVYSDAGLLAVTLTGNASEISQAASEVVKTIKSVANGEISSENFKKAVATAKFRALESGQNISTGLEMTGNGLIEGGKAHQVDEIAKSIDGVTEDQLKKVAKTLLESKASVSTVGDLYILPYAEEIGLKV